MSYYIGFRFGWVLIGHRMILWNDPQQYPYIRRGIMIRGWNVRLK